MSASTDADQPVAPEVVLVVDDEEMVRGMVVDMLAEAGFVVIAAASAEEAQRALDKQNVDLILSDIRMPGASGVDLLRWTREKKRSVPFVLMSAYADASLIVEALNLGADSFVNKPFGTEALLEVVHAKLAARRMERMQAQWARQVEKANVVLEQAVRARTVELQMATEELKLGQDVTIVALADLAEARDPETGLHIERTRTYVRRLALYLAAGGPQGYRLDEETIDLLYRTAPLHDIGKVSIPDAILLKPGKLTPDEFEVMKKHSTYGGDALAGGAKRLQPGSFLEHAATIAYQHHERWDGKGYPKGLAGEQIALSARLMAIADVYDALVTKRVYKEAMPHERAREIIVGGRGTQFDPVATDAFAALHEEFRETAARMTD